MEAGGWHQRCPRWTIEQLVRLDRTWVSEQLLTENDFHKALLEHRGNLTAIRPMSPDANEDAILDVIRRERMIRSTRIAEYQARAERGEPITRGTPIPTPTRRR